MRATALTLVAVALLPVAAGCGGSSKSHAGGSPNQAAGGSSNPHTVQSDWRAAATAMANGDGRTACGYFTPPVAKTLATSAGTSCEQAVGALARPLSPADRDSVQRAAITAVDVSGSHATIDYQLTPGLRKLQFQGRSRLVRSGGRWLIAPRSGH